jgi:transcription elongation factor GreB
MPEYITPSGYRRLKEEYDRLLKSERPRITAEVAFAAAFGDRSENAEYIYGKKRLREIDGRLRHLQKRLETVEVVDPTLLSGTRVRFGAIVEIEDDDCCRTYEIVGEDEVDVKSGRISYKSPLGHALLGREVGDEVAFQAPGGRRTLCISAVSFPRE